MQLGGFFLTLLFLFGILPPSVALALKVPGDEPVRERGGKASPGAPLAGRIWTEPESGMEFVFVEGGCFQMGDAFGDGDHDEKPVHEVCVDSFWMGKTEVTQGQWKKIMGNNPADFKEGNDHPVETVSWNDAQAFIGKLKKSRDRYFRLPTEAEWEYAARSGGKKEKLAGTSDEAEWGDYAWCSRNSENRPHRVGQRKPNGLGLYDMSGNLWEWCQDRFDSDYYCSSPRKNPQGPSSGSVRVVRGGSWINWPRFVRAAYRCRLTPDTRLCDLGFRLVFPAGR